MSDHTSRRVLSRRTLLRASLPALALAGPAQRGAAAPLKVLRVGTQKGAAILAAERQQRGLETLLNPLGVEVQWVEFQFGPPLLEAMRIGAVDIGLAGDTPPIFAQAAKSDLLYVASHPSGASAILVPAGSKLQTLADLKGKRVAFARGSSSHNLTVAALEKADLAYGDIQAIHLAPADAAAAFERGSVDAWTIWDPYYALYETRPGVRVLAEFDGDHAAELLHHQQPILRRKPSRYRQQSGRRPGARGGMGRRTPDGHRRTDRRGHRRAV